MFAPNILHTIKAGAVKLERDVIHVKGLVCTKFEVCVGQLHVWRKITKFRLIAHRSFMDCLTKHQDRTW